MSNRITELEISNFKSIKHIKMDCKRINVLIGKPNVGKSNILEALSLFIAPYGDPNKKMLADYLRYEKLSNLFYDQDRKNQIVVKTNLGFAALRFHMNGINSYDLVMGSNIDTLNALNEGGGKSMNEMAYQFKTLTAADSGDENVIEPLYAIVDDSSNFSVPDFNRYTTPIKNYHFKSLAEHKNPFASFLRPPFGDNLFTILEGNPELWNECAALFNAYGLDMLLDTEANKIEIQKKIDRRVFKVPYCLSADTLQRFIFHIAAIETNKDSVLLFEEPENHSFPPYVGLLAEKIIENDANQFFIATHSPYLLTPFIEQCPPEDISIFIASYENYETKIKSLNDKEIENIMETGIDLFYNVSAFQK